MNWFTNLSTRAKLFVVFGGMMALFAIALANTYSSLRALLDVQTLARAKQATVADLTLMEVNRNEARVAMLMLIAEFDATAQSLWLGDIKRAVDENLALELSINTRNADDPIATARLRDYRRLREEHSAARQAAIDHVVAGRVDQARTISLTDNNDRYLALREVSRELIERARQEADRALEQAQHAADRTQSLLGVIAMAVLAVSLFGIIILGKMIASPLQELLAAARSVSNGDLRTTLRLQDRRDEVGVLAHSFGTMLNSFRTVHGEIQEGVNVIAAAASEISTATSEMAASATETATAVSQTSTTVEEVKQTAQVSAQKAGHVADVAQKAAQSAHVGRRAVDDSIEGMKRIREQMELIAETVVRLSEQSQAIGEITSSVNDLAEQSNLLAVNAAIEAAKAGEHGRGFAVVAQEIRSLATQSKESTAQIRSILNDIQKATSAAVMAAEQGSKTVDAGVRQVNQSGETIRALAESIVTAAQAATQITASSQQQLIGVDQVAVAMQNILQASRQNAVGTQQAETGARNLNELGQKLKAITQRFSV